jgi:hypothetical protein
LEEKAKTEGDAVVKRLINGRMEGCSVLCVLIGSETWMRRWCRYEIFKAVERGMGVLGVRINRLSNMDKGPSYAGNSPFDWLALIPSDRDQAKLLPHVWTGSRWVRFTEADPIPASAHPKLVAGQPVKLSNLFPSENDWVGDDGYSNLGEWVHTAAMSAGRK